MHRTARTAAAAFLVLFSGSAALADWQETRARVLAYHDRFPESPALAFNGSASLAVTIEEETSRCTLSFSYPGSGDDLTNVVSTPEPSGDSGQAACDDLIADVKMIATGNIAVTGPKMRETLAALEQNKGRPTLVNETQDTETYLAIPQNEGAIFEITLSKADGRLLSLTTEFPFLDSPRGPRTLSGRIKGTTEMADLPNGQPYFARLYGTLNGVASTGVRTLTYTEETELTFADVRVVSAPAASLDAKTQPVRMETGEAEIDLCGQPGALLAHFHCLLGK